jgi:hypothetical protein
MLTHYANPTLEAAVPNFADRVTADPDECSFQFNPVADTAKFTSSCDIAKSSLSSASVLNYDRTWRRRPVTIAQIKVGDTVVNSL